MEQRIDNIQQILDLSKCIKCDIIMISGNFMYGSDIGFNYLKIIEFDNMNNININFVYKDFIKICKDMNSITIKESLKGEKNILRLSSICETANGTCEINSLRTSFHMNNLISNTMNILKFPIAHINDDLKNNNQFLKVLSMKTENGIGLVSETGSDGSIYILTMFKNLVPVNKSDNVRLEIINLDHSFLAHYIIKKKKEKITVHEYVQYLKMY